MSTRLSTYFHNCFVGGVDFEGLQKILSNNICFLLPYGQYWYQGGEICSSGLCGRKKEYYRCI
jgi:hypothetical protein